MKAGKQETHYHNHNAKNPKGKVRNESGTKKEKNQEKSGLQWFWYGEWLASHRKSALPGIEGQVEVCGGADQSKMCKRLWEVSQLFTGMGHFFGIETEVVGIAQHFFKDQSSLLQPTGAS